MKVEYIVVCAPFVRGGPTEDAYAIEQAGGGRPFFAAIADGHGSEVDEQGRSHQKSVTVARFAQAVAGGLREQFAKFPDPTFFPKIFDAVAQGVDAQFRPLAERRHLFAYLDVGAVASCLTVLEGQVVLAQTGDCRLYVADDDPTGFTQLTRDHNGCDLKERTRLQPLIDEQKFAVLPPWVDRWTLSSPRLFRHTARGWCGGLIPTRVFGDWEYQPAVVHEPEVRTFEISTVPKWTVFALCSDGGNRYVERVFKYFRDQWLAISLLEVAENTRSRLASVADDVTIIYFRVIS
ncbi:protein serine/threonine phosphatase 2C family protein [Candidatus Uhrbacteria bacterium]|nr:protein serine/threonine phosphatase 2C family protein [Candidatus Uhrbacteria bacterium]